MEWTANMGGINITYNAPQKKYLVFITDGGNTCARMNISYLNQMNWTVNGNW